LSGNAGRARLDDFRLGESRMQAIGGAKQFQHGTRGDPACLLVFNHRRPNHEAPVAARHDIGRMARMQEPHRPPKRDLAGTEHQHFALDAAQIGKCVLCREAAAIDCPIGARLLRSVAIAQRNIVEARETRGESCHRRAGIEMRFGRKEQSFLETPRKIWFEGRDPPRIDGLISARAAGKADELGSVPRGGDDERSLARRDGSAFSPEF
jgi:hypothetical protein